LNFHLAILKDKYLRAILQGTKTVECRLTKTRRAPFGQISAGDKIFLKISSGPVCAEAIVAAVKEFERLSTEKIMELRSRYGHLIGGDEQYWHSKADSGYCVLVWLEGVRAIEPVKIQKKDWRAWVVLTKSKNFGLLDAQDR
jgi:ASC-1-like (ASCH) protein